MGKKMAKIFGSKYIPTSINVAKQLKRYQPKCAGTNKVIRC